MIRIGSVAIGAIAIHLGLGWAWTVLAGVGIGLWHGQTLRSMGIGALGVGLGWATLVGYSFLASGPSTRVMIDTVGGLMGNTADWLVVAATVLIGSLLGMLGGLVGGQFARLFGLRSAATPK